VSEIRPIRVILGAIVERVVLVEYAELRQCVREA
jgi:hypothetical protein